MSNSQFRKKHHYTPELYLKRWADSEKKIFCYRTLVSHDSVPIWDQKSIRGVAYHPHLYTQLDADGEMDEFERWLERDFETPAAEALEKATSDKRLTRDDWRKLVRFLAAQDLRTPARLAERSARWKQELQTALESALQVAANQIDKEIDASKRSNPSSDIRNSQGSQDEHSEAPFPFRVTKILKPGQEYGVLETRILAGRSYWLWELRGILTRNLKLLHEHKWTIVKPPESLDWFTSDNPVVRLNYHGRNIIKGDLYSFEGDWTRPGTTILLPLGPKHLLYTQVGDRPLRRGTRMSISEANQIRRFIAEHAHRMIFSRVSDPEVPRLRRRVVNDEQFKAEKEKWERWHDVQSNAEREFMNQKH